MDADQTTRELSLIRVHSVCVRNKIILESNSTYAAEERDGSVVEC